MKAHITLQFVFCCLCIVLNVACKKTYSGPGNGIEPEVDADLNRVYTGYDRMVVWPKSECIIGASLTIVSFGRYAVNGPLKLEWRIISGPGSPQLEIIDNSTIKLSQLSIGVYQIEASFDKSYGTHNRDTTRVIVDSLSNPPVEVILPNQHWVAEYLGYSLGSSITIEGIYNTIPPGNAFRTFIRKANNSNWEELLPEVTNSWYEYSFKNGVSFGIIANSVISIWSANKEEDTADIKLLY